MQGKRKKKIDANDHISLPFKTMSNGHNACIMKYENVTQFLAEKVHFFGVTGGASAETSQ